MNPLKITPFLFFWILGVITPSTVLAIEPLFFTARVRVGAYCEGRSEISVSRPTEDRINAHVTSLNQEFRRMVEQGEITLDWSPAEEAIRQFAIENCEPYRIAECTVAIKANFATVLAKDYMNRHVREFQKLAEEAVQAFPLEHSTQAKPVLNYFKSRFPIVFLKDVLLVLVNPLPPSQSLVQNSTLFLGLSSSTKLVDVDLSISPSDIRFPNSSFNENKPLRLLLRMNGYKKFGEIVAKTFFGFSNIIFVDRSIYTFREPLPFEVLLTHQLRHYVDSLLSPDLLDQNREEQNNGKRHVSGDEIMGEWLKFKRDKVMRQALIQVIFGAKQKDFSVNLDKLHDNLMVQLRDSFTRMYLHYRGTLNSRAEILAYKEQLKYLIKVKNFPLVPALLYLFPDSFFIDNATATIHTSRRFVFKGNEFTEVPTLLPDVILEKFKKLYEEIKSER